MAIACETCGESAAVVVYVPAGETHPLAASLSLDRPRIVVEGFLGCLTESVTHRARPLADALSASNTRGLWRVDPLWAPFYCPECDVSYCRDHWTTEVVFADDAPGWYEHTNGRCPKGHVRMLDD